MPVQSPHQENENGVFLCSALNKHASVVTTHRGFKACGHCLRFVVDANGNRQPFTVLDCLTRGER